MQAVEETTFDETFIEFFCSLLVCSMLNCFGYYSGEQVYAVLSHVADALLAAEGKLNELDNLAGDGDCGSTLSRGASGT